MRLSTQNHPFQLSPGIHGVEVGFDETNVGRKPEKREDKMFVSQGSRATDRQSLITQELARVILAISNLRIDPKGDDVFAQENRFSQVDPLSLSPAHWVKAVYHRDVEAVTLQLKTDAIESSPGHWTGPSFYQVTVSRAEIETITGNILPPKKTT